MHSVAFRFDMGDLLRLVADRRPVPVCWQVVGLRATWVTGEPVVAYLVRAVVTNLRTGRPDLLEEEVGEAEAEAHPDARVARSDPWFQPRGVNGGVS